MDTKRTLGPLTVRDAIALGAIVRMAQENQHIARAIDDGRVVVEGTARSIGDDQGFFARADDDVRSCYLRVTTDGGFEAFWPVVDLVEDLHAGLFMPCQVKPHTPRPETASQRERRISQELFDLNAKDIRTR